MFLCEALNKTNKNQTTYYFSISICLIMAVAVKKFCVLVVFPSLILTGGLCLLFNAEKHGSLTPLEEALHLQSSYEKYTPIIDGEITPIQIIKLKNGMASELSSCIMLAASLINVKLTRMLEEQLKSQVIFSESLIWTNEMGLPLTLLVPMCDEKKPTVDSLMSTLQGNLNLSNVNIDFVALRMQLKQLEDTYIQVIKTPLMTDEKLNLLEVLPAIYDQVLTVFKIPFSVNSPTTFSFNSFQGQINKVAVNTIKVMMLNLIETVDAHVTMALPVNKAALESYRKFLDGWGIYVRKGDDFYQTSKCGISQCSLPQSKSLFYDPGWLKRIWAVISFLNLDQDTKAANTYEGSLKSKLQPKIHTSGIAHSVHANALMAAMNTTTTEEKKALNDSMHDRTIFFCESAPNLRKRSKNTFSLGNTDMEHVSNIRVPPLHFYSNATCCKFDSHAFKFVVKQFMALVPHINYFNTQAFTNHMMLKYQQYISKHVGDGSSMPFEQDEAFLPWKRNSTSKLRRSKRTIRTILNAIDQVIEPLNRVNYNRIFQRWFIFNAWGNFLIALYNTIKSKQGESYDLKLREYVENKFLEAHGMTRPPEPEDPSP
ncbi:uncharacterized protein LOC108681432 [Hyalella azteca]|uniref:Uncharacterized protein LOC108681432 n=1 Tax=Hyalella azteca TaxID=294128 RepID=A0A8B7PKI9_HYAAZ|nr:uncharacterized protein LOC108681432 [Hyalella azteca]